MAKAQASSIKRLDQKRRQVFKPILDNPYTQVAWPKTSPEKSAAILGVLLSVLSPIGRYSKTLKESEKLEVKPEKPEILDHVTIGFNSTTKALEAKARGTYAKDILYVFVCKADIQPALLVQHFPILSFTASSEGKPVRLVQLPRYSMERLSDAVGKSHTSIVGMESGCSDILSEIVDSEINPVVVPWLQGANYQLTKVKLLRTTQPIVQKNNQKKKKGDPKSEKG